MKKYLLIILVLPFLVSATVPDEYLADLEKMRAFFEKEKLSVTLSYKVYAQTTGKLLDSRSGVYEKTPAGYYYSVDEITIIQNDQWNLYLNEEEKLMAVKERDEASARTLMSFDEATKGCDMITRVQDDQTYVYTITFKKPVSEIYSSVTIVARKSNLAPLKVIFNYAQTTDQTDQSGTLIQDKLRFEISYTEVSTDVNRSFSTGTYFKEENDLLVPAAKYSSYQFFDQRTHNLK